MSDMHHETPDIEVAADDWAEEQRVLADLAAEEQRVLADAEEQEEEEQRVIAEEQRFLADLDAEDAAYAGTNSCDALRIIDGVAEPEDE